MYRGLALRALKFNEFAFILCTIRLMLLAVYWNNFHVLNLLLLLEVGSLLVSLIVAFCSRWRHTSIILMIFFTLVVCEAALGLRVIIKSVRVYGSDISAQI